MWLTLTSVRATQNTVADSLLCFFLKKQNVLRTCRCWLTRAVVYMDQDDDCDRVLTQTQDLIEGDVFVVKSDGYGGKTSSSQRPPAECSVAFNLGSRRLSVAVVEWTCEETYKEPVLHIYADCTVGQKRSKRLVSCTSSLHAASVTSASLTANFHQRYLV